MPDGQWYLHLFTPEQPDLNWDNREVREDFLKTLRFWSDRGVDGFRVDVAHGLAKNLAEPLERLDGQAALVSLPPGTHPLWDRDEVHGIYAEWRQVFNEYDPPRAGVAEAWVPPSRRPRYASPHGLGQAFNFDLLEANWNAGEFLRIITDNLAEAQQHGTSTTWVLSNHDVVRHASRYGLQAGDYLSSTQNAKTWLFSNGTSPELNCSLGLRRARAATLLMLALPGSAYLYQGEELGLHEVADLAPDVRPGSRLPAVRRRGKGPRRVPGPAALDDRRPVVRVQHRRRAPAAAGLVRPAQRRGAGAGSASTLALYRQALSWRRQLQPAESLEWMPGTNGQVLHFGRPGGWRSVTNFGPGPVPLPHGTVVVASSPLQEGLLPADTTAWIISPAPDRVARRQSHKYEPASDAMPLDTRLDRPTARRLTTARPNGRHTCCDWQTHGHGTSGSPTTTAPITCTSSEPRVTSATLMRGTTTSPSVMPCHRILRTGPWSLTRSRLLTARHLMTSRPGPARWCAAGTASGSCSIPAPGSRERALNWTPSRP